MARILIVDDTNIGRINIKKVVVEAGHEVVGEAENGLQAFQMFMRYHPDLVTMDITMPVMDGISALKKIIMNEPTAKVIMVSAVGQQLMVLDSIKCGARHFLVKPFRDDDLLKNINDVLGAEMRIQPTKLCQPNENKDKDENRKNGFYIENVMGTFLIKMSKELQESDLQILRTVINGIIYISPLKVVFDFGNLEFIRLDILEKVNEVLKMIKVAGGEVRLTTNNKRFREYLKVAGIEM